MKNKLLLNSLYLMLLTLGGCTPYKADGIMGGYSNLQLNQNTYEVAFRGNGFTSPERVHGFLLRRCAEITLKNGYKYFVIADGGTRDYGFSYNTPAHIYSSGSGNYYGNSYYGGISGSENTTIYPSQTAVIHRFKTMVTMKMTNRNSSDAYDAAIILRNYQ